MVKSWANVARSGGSGAKVNEVGIKARWLEREDAVLPLGGLADRGGGRRQKVPSPAVVLPTPSDGKRV